MSAAVNQFLGVARQATLTTEQPRILVNEQTELMKWCEACRAIYPHVVTLDGSECAVLRTCDHAARQSPNPAVFMACKGIQERRKLEIRTLSHLARILREKHAELNSWPKTSVDCGVLTKDGRPNPGLAQRIALQDYEPARRETQERLSLKPVCNSCGRKFKRVHHIPAWLMEAVETLRRLEAAANPAPAPVRRYGRGGRRAERNSE